MAILKDGYTLMQWDGKTTRPIVDPVTGKVFMVLVSAPNDPTYRAACDEVANVLETHAQSGSFTGEELSHKREPRQDQAVEPTQQDAPMVASLLANIYVQRIAIFASCRWTYPSYPLTAVSKRVSKSVPSPSAAASPQAGLDQRHPKIWTTSPCVTISFDVQLPHRVVEKLSRRYYFTQLLNIDVSRFFRLSPNTCGPKKQYCSDIRY
ncbi:hypothetical protein BKA70DRAFT_1214175 [Coprinopsis sp. MPI-PUGE-AT-0042]|nr:hypothetical protein BKA70DRAFT_1214175 [Coprinopsis sp. MPI-PUGE-AT-0042]